MPLVDEQEQQLVVDMFKTINRKLKPEKLPLDTGYTAQNIRYDDTIGVIYKRPSRKKFNSTSLGTDPIKSQWKYYKSSGKYYIISTSTFLKLGGSGTFTNIKTGLTSNMRWKFLVYKDFLYCFDGIDTNQVYNGSACEDMGVPIPTAPSGADKGSGSGPNGAYKYKVTYLIDSYQEGTASAASETVTVTDNTITVTIPTSANTRVTHRKIYRTAASGAVYYYLATVSDNTTTTYDDSIADGSLGTDTAPTDYGAPGTYKYPCLHKERIFIGYNTTYKSRIIFSDIRSGTSYPDVFPTNNALKIAEDDGDVLTGLINDNFGNLVVFKEKSIRIINTDADSTTAWQIGTPLTNLGCVAPYSIVKTPQGVVYITRLGNGKNRLMLWTGSGSKMICPEIDSFLESIDVANLKEVVCHYHNGKLHISYTDNTDFGSESVDTYTKLLLHCNGTDSSTSFVDSSLTARTITNTENYDSYTKFMCHCDGTTTTFVEEIDNVNHAITAGGNATQSSAQYKWTKSALFDGTGDYLSVLHSADWDFGSGAFTVDFWVRFDDVTQTMYFFAQDNGAAADIAWNLIYYGGAVKQLKFGYTTDGTTVVQIGNSWAPANDTWYHVAVVRTGNNMMMFVDGTQIGTTQTLNATIFNSASALVIGCHCNLSSNPFDGYLDELRISKGVARWTAAFSSPPHPFGQVAVDTTTKKFGTGSAWFDGESYLTTADSDDWDFGSGDFTIDLWVRFDSVSGNQVLVSKHPTAEGQRAWEVLFQTGLISLQYSTTGSDTAEKTAAWSPVANTLYHVAIVRSGNSLYFFVDGTQVGTTQSMTGITIYTGTATVDVGRRSGTASFYFAGYIDELRISKGIARWTSNFTPPTLEYGYGYNNKDLMLDMATQFMVNIDAKYIDSFSDWNGGTDVGELYTGTSDTSGFCYEEEQDTNPSETSIEIQWKSGKIDFGAPRVRKRLKQVKIEFTRTTGSGTLNYYYSLDGGAETTVAIDLATYYSQGYYIYQFPLATYCNYLEHRFLNDDLYSLGIRKITYIYSLEPLVPII